MKKALIIGCGKVARVAVPIIGNNPKFFREICLSSRTKAKCDEYKAKYSSDSLKVITAYVDVRNTEKTTLMVRIFKPDVVINLAPSHLNLNIMELCLQTRANYVDASMYYPRGSAICGLAEQKALNERFVNMGLTAITGCGFNPGVTGVFTQYAKTKLFDSISSLDVIDVNAGTNAHPYLMNSPIITNIRQITSEGRYWEKGAFVKTAPISVKAKYVFPEVGRRSLYLLDHEVLDSFAQEMPDIETIRFFSSFKRPFLYMVKTLETAGMTSTELIDIDGQQISPLAFLTEVMPQQEDLAATAKGRTGIGCVFRGMKNGKEKTCMLYSTADHSECYEKYGASANDYMAAVPVVVGAIMILSENWNKRGVHTVADFDPEPFLEELKNQGLEYKLVEKANIVDAISDLAEDEEEEE